MRKIIVFDCGYGGELLADYLEEALPIIKIIRVIDWRNAEKFQQDAKIARKITHDAINKHIGKADLIIFANYLVSATSLKYFQRRYKSQRFIGLNLAPNDDLSIDKCTFTFTTKALTKTIDYLKFAHKTKTKTLVLDDWPLLIDDGELGHAKIRRDLASAILNKPAQIYLGCSQFVDLEAEFRRLLGHNIKIIDNFDLVLRETCQILKIRGSLKKKK